MMNFASRLRAIERQMNAAGCDHNLAHRNTEDLEALESILERLLAPCGRCGWTPAFVDLVELATDEDAEIFTG